MLCDLIFPPFPPLYNIAGFNHGLSLICGNVKFLLVDVQKVLYTAQNVRSRVGCAKSALYSTKCTLESGMCKKCSIQHKMYAREWDVQKVLYTA